MPDVIYDFDPHNLPDGFLEAVGLVITAASQTEYVMCEFIGALLNIDVNESTALTAHMTVPLKDDIIRCLAELNAPSASEVDQIDDILDDIRSAIDKRNIIAHNALIRDPNTNEVFTMRERARGSLQISLTPISVEEIRESAREIYEAGMRLMSFMISRGLGTSVRTEPLREPLNRRKAARAQRRQRPI